MTRRGPFQPLLFCDSVMILLYCTISTYDMITSLCMKVGLYLHEALRSFPYLGSYVLEFVNNQTQPVRKTGGDTLPHSVTPPLSFRVVLRAFENFQYPWDAQASTLLLFCLLNGFQLLFRVKHVVKSIVQRPDLGLDSCEWLGVWDSTGKYLGQWAPPVCFKLTPEQVQDPDKLVKYLQKVCCHPGNSRETQITATCWGLAHAYRASLFNTVQCPKGEGGGKQSGRHCDWRCPPSWPCSPSSPGGSHSPPDRHHRCCSHWRCPGSPSRHGSCCSSRPSSSCRHRG